MQLWLKFKWHNSGKLKQISWSETVCQLVYLFGKSQTVQAIIIATIVQWNSLVTLCSKGEPHTSSDRGKLKELRFSLWYSCSPRAVELSWALHSLWTGKDQQKEEMTGSHLGDERRLKRSETSSQEAPNSSPLSVLFHLLSYSFTHEVSHDVPPSRGRYTFPKKHFPVHQLWV